jgi:hypothetical protein
MKIFKFILGIPIVSLVVLSAGTQFSACMKTVTVHDTTTVVVRDTTTITIKDTLRTDSIYNLTDGLVAYYNFNGGSLHDSSGNGNDIFLDTNTTLAADRFGNPNNAYSFNGFSSFMEVKNSVSLNPDSITLFAIVKVNGFYNGFNAGSCTINHIFGKGYPDDIDGFYAMRFSNDNPCNIVDSTTEHFFGVYGDNLPYGAATGAGSSSFPLVTKGQWFTLVYTNEGLNSKFYINGIINNLEQKAVNFTPNTHDLFIGKHEDPSFPYYFNGVIDEIRIYNKALSYGAVLQLSKVKE